MRAANWIETFNECLELQDYLSFYSSHHYRNIVHHHHHFHLLLLHLAHLSLIGQRNTLLFIQVSIYVVTQHHHHNNNLSANFTSSPGGTVNLKLYCFNVVLQLFLLLFFVNGFDSTQSGSLYKMESRPVNKTLSMHCYFLLTSHLNV